MSSPFILVTRLQVKEGKSEEFRKWFEGFAAQVEAKEPRLIAFNVYGNEDGTEVVGIQVHPDAASMELHMRVMRESFTAAMADLLGPTITTIVCGDGEEARRTIAQLSGSGAPLVSMPRHLGGFTRSSAQR